MSESWTEMEIDPEWANIFRKRTIQTPSLSERLSGVPIFSLLGRRELELIGRIVHWRRYAAGETIIHQARRQSGFYLICSGAAEIVSQNPGDPREVLGLLPAGTVIGEFALIDNAPRTSSIVASQPSELICFFNSDLMAILETKPVIGCKIVLRLAEEMNRSLRRSYAELRTNGYPWLSEKPS